ncbi:P-II family nitrogen regulator, partial [Sediminivirga luteola]|uniref:P-II family nitrogen regulator n=1 Tax=Sediminivirga luteola TaxID=1774748 RepID=UPI003BB74E5F|nr:hypothetical protein [Sediminivirga luteola]
MHGLTEMTKVEFVVPGRDAPSIRALITAAGATGYTAVSGVSGIGHHGQHSGALLFNDYDTGASPRLVDTLILDRGSRGSEFDPHG